MPRPRPPYLLKEKTRHGRTVWYFRRGDGPRIRVHGDFGSEAFQASYNAASRGELAKPVGKTRTGSLNWLWDRYRETTVWGELSPATRRARENIMAGVLKTAGDEPFGDITRVTMEEGKDRRRDTPAQARNFLDTMRGLFRWAKNAKHVDTDPTFGVANPKRKRGRGFPEWTEEDVAAYYARWPVGTKERVWIDVLLYTGPRRGDAVKLGRQHMQLAFDPVSKSEVRLITFRTQKGGEQIEVSIPLLPVLWDTLKAGPTGDLAFIVGENRKPLTKESFGNMFSTAARAAGVRKSAHGVRKIAATTAANNGATVHQLMAIFGWLTSQMAELYTKGANRKRLAMSGMHTLKGTPEQRSIPAPKGQVRG